MVILAPILASLAVSALFIASRAFHVNGELYFVLFDDAMISMRYARNLVEGHGFVWNPGGAPVEGYTNFLWTLWMAVMHLPGLPDSKTSLLVSASGAVILVLNLLTVRSIAIRLVPEERAVSMLALWLTTLCVPLVYWTLVGLEVGLLALLTSLAILLALRLVQAFRHRDLLLLASVLALAVLVRTDQIVLCTVVLGFLGLALPPAHRARVLLTLGLAVVVTMGAHTAFRLAYYGHPFPNSYYLKLGGISTRVRLTRGLASLGTSSLGVLHAPSVFAVVALWRTTPVARRGVLLLLAVFFGPCAYSVIVGGDVWEWFAVTNRFVTPALPALLLASAVGAWGIVTYSRRLLLWILAVLFALLPSGRDFVSAILFPGAQNPVAYATVSIWQRSASVGGRVLACLPSLLLGLAAIWPGRMDLTPNRARARWQLLVCGLAVLVAANAGPAVVLRLSPGAGEDSQAASLTRLAVAVRDSTGPTASIAVVWAGMMPYFAHRPAVDFLGRTDATIARLPSRAQEFLPGHTKWDYEYSIGQLRPDVVLQLWAATPEDVTRIIRLGYEQILDVFVRGDSPTVDRARLRSALCQLQPERCRSSAIGGDPKAHAASGERLPQSASS